MLKKQILDAIYGKFREKTGYGIVVGVEQEFYIREEEFAEHNQSLIMSCLNAELSKFPFFSEVEKEKGEGQFEVQISPADNPAVMADMVEMLRKLVCGLSFIDGREYNDKLKTTNNKRISFSAKPYPDQPGSAMHVNINLTDSEGNNVFCRNGEAESTLLEYSIAGLLELMPASMKYFAPYDEAYIRYTEHGMESPSTYSWGADNRTVALRIPSVPLNPYARRIEHRVSCADSDPYLVIAAIIAGLEYGIVNKLENKHPKIWGNAFLPQYNLSKLPHSFAEADNIQHEYLENIM